MDEGSEQLQSLTSGGGSKLTVGSSLDAAVGSLFSRGEGGLRWCSLHLACDSGVIRWFPLLL